MLRDHRRRRPGRGGSAEKTDDLAFPDVGGEGIARRVAVFQAEEAGLRPAAGGHVLKGDDFVGVLFAEFLVGVDGEPEDDQRIRHFFAEKRNVRAHVLHKCLVFFRLTKGDTQEIELHPRTSEGFELVSGFFVQTPLVGDRADDLAVHRQARDARDRFDARVFEMRNIHKNLRTRFYFTKSLMPAIISKTDI